MLQNIISKKNKTHTKKSSPQRRLILVVEDDITSEPIWRHIIDRAYPESKCDWATSGAQAEQFIKKAKDKNINYDLIITDIFLSGAKTGIDLWNKYSHTLTTKMIVISSIEHEKLEHYYKDERIKPQYIKKPIDIEECVKTIKAALNI